MLQGLIKIIFYALFAYIVYQVFRFFKVTKMRKTPPRVSKHTSGTMVKDEVCNTYLPEEDALKEMHQGKEYYFCSRECQKKFLDEKKLDSSPPLDAGKP
jgi:uncharacterized protein